MNLLSRFPKKRLCRSPAASFIIRPLSTATHGRHPSTPFTAPAQAQSASSLPLYLLGLSISACAAALMCAQGKSSVVFCAAAEEEEGGAAAVEKMDKDENTTTSVFKSFLKELHVLLRADQINLDAEDCIDRGKPCNSYHKSDVFPQVCSFLFSFCRHQPSLVCVVCLYYL